MLMDGGCRWGRGLERRRGPAFLHCTAVLIPSQQERQLPSPAIQTELDISLHLAIPAA